MYFHVLVIVFFLSDCHHFSWLPFYPLEMMSLGIYLSPQTTDALKNLTESMDLLLKRKKKKSPLQIDFSMTHLGLIDSRNLSLSILRGPDYELLFSVQPETSASGTPWCQWVPQILKRLRVGERLNCLSKLSSPEDREGEGEDFSLRVNF